MGSIHGPGKGSATSGSGHQRGHVCDPDCYHQSAAYKNKQARKKRRAMHEKLYNPALMRGRQPYPKDRVVPMRLLGVIPLVIAADSPVPSPELIKEATKAYAAARNKRRNRRP